jgi:hypothetical protein
MFFCWGALLDLHADVAGSTSTAACKHAAGTLFNTSLLHGTEFDYSLLLHKSCTAIMLSQSASHAH